jgi:integrase
MSHDAGTIRGRSTIAPEFLAGGLVDLVTSGTGQEVAVPRKRRAMGGVDKLPSGRYRVRVGDSTGGRRISIGTFATKAEAERAYAQVVTDQGRGAWVRPDDGRVTLVEYAPQWVECRLTSRGEPLRPRVVELYEGQLRLHILPVLGAIPIGKLTTARVRSWHADLLAHGPGPSTAAKCYRLLRAILTTAVEDGLLAANPCRIKGAGVEPADERPVPSIAEVYALADAVPPRYRALVLMAAFGGLRRGELFGLTRRDIDPLHRTVTVSIQRQENAHGQPLVGAPKTDAGKRTIVLPKQLLIDIEEHLDTWAGPGPDGVVFLGAKGSPLRPQVWQTEWNRTRRRLGLDEVHFHDLRHVAGTLAAATGAGTKELDVPAGPRLASGGPALPARHEGTRHRHRRRHGGHDAGGSLRSRSGRRQPSRGPDWPCRDPKGPSVRSR